MNLFILTNFEFLTSKIQKNVDNQVAPRVLTVARGLIIEWEVNV